MQNWLIELLMKVLVSISPSLREELVKFATEFRNKAKGTANPWDDILAEALCWIIGVK